MRTVFKVQIVLNVLLGIFEVLLLGVVYHVFVNGVIGFWGFWDYFIVPLWAFFGVPFLFYLINTSKIWKGKDDNK